MRSLLLQSAKELQSGIYTDFDGGPLTKNVALLSGHDGEVWQLEWNMDGMTLEATAWLSYGRPTWMEFDTSRIRKDMVS
ncbi:unnamed protein product [Urochloa humidicola]